MCDVHKTERAVHSPFSARLWSVQYPFESRLTSVLLKRSGVKRTVHGKFFLPYTVCTKSIYGMGHIKVPVFCKLKNAILPLHETQVIKNGTVSLNGK